MTGTSEMSMRRADRVARRIEDAIATGEFGTAARLPPERELARRWGVSRSTVREGVGLLVARGALIRRRGDGTYVNDRGEQRTAEIWAEMVRRNPDLQVDMIEFRQMLECTAARLAARRHDEDDAALLAAAWTEVDRAYQQHDRRAQVRADVAFHRAIADATHNPVFSYLLMSLLSLLYEHVQLSIAGLTPDSKTAVQLRAQHRGLYEAIVKRDDAAAARFADAHMEFVRTRLNDVESGRSRPPPTVRP